MQIVDAQIHIWSQGLPSNLSHRQVTHFTPEEAIPLMDEAGIDAAIIHPPGWDSNSTRDALRAVKEYPGRFAIMGAMPLDRPESRARIASWRDQPGMLGLRYGFLGDPARRWLHDGTIEWLWAAAEKAGVPIAMLATDSLTEIGRIAERHPGLRLTIDHLGGRGGTSTLKDAAAMTHMPDLLALAKYPMSRSRRPAFPTIRVSRIRSRRCTLICARFTTPSVRSACSGAPTSRRCPAPGGNA